MKSARIDFPGHSGAKLSARLEAPARRPRAYALFAHCFTCGKDGPAARNVARALAARDIATFRFDFTGLGRSDGDFAHTDFSSNVEDLIAAAAWLREHHQAPTILIGHSLGGAAVLAAAGDISEAKAVAVIGAPADPSHVAHLFDCALEDIAAQGVATVDLAGRPFQISQRFVDDIQAVSLTPKIADLRRDLLVMHAPRDEVVSVDNAAEIFRAAKHPKSFVSLGDADHLLTRAADADYAAEVIAAWASRHTAPALADYPEEGVRVIEAARDGFLHDVLAPRGRSLISDEPLKVGGTDLGLTPIELTVAALGACTSMTLRAYASRKGWNIGETRVDAIYEHDPTEHRYSSDRYMRVIVFADNVSPEQRERLLEIADRCPVHRVLAGTCEVVTAVG